MEFLDDATPTVFCVQETKAHLEQVEEGVKTLGYQYGYWSSAIRKGYSGTATFTDKEPTAVLKGIGIEEFDSEGRFVITDHGAFDLYNIYFPNGGSGEERHNFKQKFLKELNSHLKKKVQSGREIIVVGDYNVAHKEADLHDPKRLAKHSGFLPEERAWFDSFLELGFIDTFRHFHPDAKERYSWWDQRQLARISNRGWRIDYICVSKNLKSKLASADILDQVMGSDHCPVVVELSL